MHPSIIAILISFIVCLALYGISQRLIWLVRRIDQSAPQSAHTHPALRLGGIGVFVSISLTQMIFFNDPDLLSKLIFCSIPLLIFGLLEDVGIHQPPLIRFISAIFSSVMFIALTGTYLQEPGIFFLNPIFEYYFIGWLFTIFITSGIVNAFNLIDGLNGLTGLAALSAAAGIAAVSHIYGLDIIVSISVICGAIIGFLFLNFPFGKIFLGDAGAYGIGFILSWLSIEVLKNAPEVSPWAMLMMFFWPCADTLVTISRRLISNKPISRPDRLHFHQVVMRSLEISVLGRGRRKYANPLATITLFPFIALPPLLAVLFADNNLFCSILVGLFMVLFASTYCVLIKLAAKFRRNNYHRHFARGTEHKD